MKKYITTQEAYDIVFKDIGDAAPTQTTIRNWCRRPEDGGFGIGLKIGGRWKVDKRKLIQLIRG